MAKKNFLLGALCFTITSVLPLHAGIRSEVIDVARSQIGVIETSENKGKTVDIYIRHCGIYTPIPWCGCFVKYVFDSCGLESPVSPQAAKSWFTGNVIGNPVIACNVGFYFSSLKGIHHVGLCEYFTSEDVIVIAGNTNDKNIREGDKVMRKRYPITQNIYFADWVKEKESYYTVKPQDTLYRISNLFGVSIQSLVEKNHLTGYRIEIGQRLEL